MLHQLAESYLQGLQHVVQVKKTNSESIADIGDLNLLSIWLFRLKRYNRALATERVSDYPWIGNLEEDRCMMSGVVTLDVVGNPLNCFLNTTARSYTKS